MEHEPGVGETAEKSKETAPGELPEAVSFFLIDA